MKSVSSETDFRSWEWGISIPRLAKLPSAIIAKNGAAHGDHTTVLGAVMSNDGVTVNQECVHHGFTLAVWADLF